MLNVERTSGTHSAIAWCAFFVVVTTFWHPGQLLSRLTATWNLILQIDINRRDCRNPWYLFKSQQFVVVSKTFLLLLINLTLLELYLLSGNELFAFLRTIQKETWTIIMFMKLLTWMNTECEKNHPQSSYEKKVIKIPIKAETEAFLDLRRFIPTVRVILRWYDLADKVKSQKNCGANKPRK